MPTLTRSHAYPLLLLELTLAACTMPTAPTPPPPPFSGVRIYAAASSLEHAPVGATLLDATAAASRLHWTFTLANGVVTEVQEVRPGNNVRQTLHYDGGRVKDIVGPEGVVTSTFIWAPDGRQFKRVARSAKSENGGCTWLRLSEPTPEPATSPEPEPDAAQGVSAAPQPVAGLECVDDSGRLQLNNDGIAVTSYTRDAMGMVIEESYFDIDRAPTIRNDGIGKTQFTRNAEGLVQSQSTRGQDGKLATSMLGCAVVDYTLTAGLVATETCLDSGNRPTTNTEYGVKRRTTRDERGCVTKYEYLSADDKTAVLPDGVATEAWVVDPTCHDLEWTRFGAGDEALPPKVIRTFNADGSEAAYHYVSPTTGKPISNSLLEAPGVYGELFEYDAMGRRTKEKYLDGKGNPGWVGGAKWAGLTWQEEINEYDADGRRVREFSTTTSGKPTANTRSTVYTYDSRGRTASYIQKTPRGQIRYQETRLSYNSRNQKTEDRLYDAKGNPANWTGTSGSLGYVTYHRKERVYSETFQLLENRLYDLRGRLTKTVDCAKNPSDCW
jgi:hypothetical protein